MIKMNNISKSYILNDDETPLYVLKDINLNIEEKEFTAIMGPSGSGKSTLINIISFWIETLKEITTSQMKM